MIKTHLYTLVLILSAAFSLKAQDIDELLEEASGNEPEQVTTTFKSTRIVSGYSIERMPEGQPYFRISHRFGQLNSGAWNLWGPDQANIHFSFE